MIKTEKPPVDPELQRRIQDLIEYKGGGFNQENVADIIENALKLLHDVKDAGDVRVIQTALRELRYAFRLFAPYARTRKVPYFGICLGMQCAVIEYARNVAGLEGADSSEFDPATSHRVIYKLRELRGIDELGGTMRLGAWTARLRAGC